MVEAPALSQLTEWQNFYVIVGSSAGALIGLQFVVIALMTGARATGSMLEIRAFGTPTVVHFCAALLISAILSAPWHALHPAAIALGVGGATGVAYALRFILHARRQTGYAPDAEDWFWYAVVPLLAYLALLTAALLLARHAQPSLFVIAATALVLLFCGIHNAWDTVTYVAVKHLRPKKEDSGER